MRASSPSFASCRWLLSFQTKFSLVDWYPEFHPVLLNAHPILVTQSHLVLHLYVSIFHTADTSSICVHVSVFIHSNLPVCLPSTVSVVTQSFATIQFVHLPYNTTFMPLVGKAWAYEGLHFQIQQLAKAKHSCRKEWLAGDDCSPENVRQRARDFLHRAWTPAVMRIGSSARANHPKPKKAILHSKIMEVFKGTTVPWTEYYREQPDTPTIHKKTSGTVAVNLIVSCHARSHWRKNVRRRCKTMAALKKGFRHYLP